MKGTLVNGRWSLLLPDHRAARPQWGHWVDESGKERFGWEVERLDAMARNVHPGDVVFDVGAEEGDISALLAMWSSGGGVVLIEPNPKVWGNIGAIWAANRLPDPLACFVGFASDVTKVPEESDVGKVFASAGGVWPDAAFGPVIGDHGFRHLAEEADVTPQRRLDDIAAGLGTTPDVITIDVEGAELKVLAGAEWILAELRPLVFVSIHPEFLRDLYGAIRDDVLDLMAGHGYQAEHLATDHEEHVAFWHPEGRRFK